MLAHLDQSRSGIHPKRATSMYRHGWLRAATGTQELVVPQAGSSVSGAAPECRDLGYGPQYGSDGTSKRLRRLPLRLCMPATPDLPGLPWTDLLDATNADTSVVVANAAAKACCQKKVVQERSAVTIEHSGISVAVRATPVRCSSPKF
jgi:hypothetical protein